MCCILHLWLVGSSYFHSLLKASKFSFRTHFSPDFFIIFVIITLMSFFGRLPVSLPLRFSLSFLSCSFTWEHIPSLPSFWLSCFFCFYVWGRLVPFLSLGKVSVCRRPPVSYNPSAVPSCHSSCMGFLLRGLSWSFLCNRLTMWLIW